MKVRVVFYSYCRDLAGCAEVFQEVEPGSTLGDLFQSLLGRFPALEGMRQSLLLAVGVEYQKRSYVLVEGDEVALFPPVQGG